MKIKEVSTKEELFKIADDTYEVWNNSLSIYDYKVYQSVMLENDWAKKNSKYIYLEDKKQILSSLKLYQIKVMLEGVRYKCYEICAIYTKKEYRNRGYASYLIDYVISNYDGFFFLYSDISPSFYERFGFLKMPIYKVSLDIDEGDKVYLFSYEKREYPPYTMFYYRNERLYFQKEQGFYSYRYDKYLSFIRLKTGSYVREFFLNIFGVGEAYIRTFRRQAILLDFLPVNYDKLRDSLFEVFKVLASFNIKKITLLGPKSFLSNIVDKGLEESEKNIPMILPIKEEEEKVREIIKGGDFYVCKADFL